MAVMRTSWRLPRACSSASAKAHAFLQGNKRTAFVGAIMLLRLNGWTLSTRTDSVELAESVLELIRGGISEEEFADLLRPHIEAYTR